MLPLETGRQTVINAVLSRIKSVKPTVTIALSEAQISEKIEKFCIGYLDNEHDPQSVRYHSTQIPVYINTDGNRKSILALEQISSTLVQINFWLFGSELDAPEWNQRGITETDFPVFKEFLHNLFDKFDFIIGTLGYEVSATDLFDTEDGWPSEKYSLDNLKRNAFEAGDHFLMIAVNKKYLDLTDVDGVVTSENKQIREK